jgi:hypothetical protein
VEQKRRVSNSSGRRREGALADETGVQHARCVQRSLRLVECGAAEEPGELVS